MLVPLTPGQRIARGVCRHLRELGHAALLEIVPAPGLRADVMALGPGAEIWIVECKSGREDFASDRKWAGYLDWCNSFFWAVDPNFPLALLPPDTGLILADGYGAEILRHPVPRPLAAARRRALVLRFARTAAARLDLLIDPPPGLTV